jgi:hypothetical protein
MNFSSRAEARARAIAIVISKTITSLFLSLTLIGAPEFSAHAQDVSAAYQETRAVVLNDQLDSTEKSAGLVDFGQTVETKGVIKLPLLAATPSRLETRKVSRARWPE